MSQTVSCCPHCAKPLVVEPSTLEDGSVVYGRAPEATTEHVTVHAINGTVRCYDRPKVANEAQS